MSIFHSDTITIDRDNDGSFVLKIDCPDRSLNVITRGFLADLDRALQRLVEQPRVPVLIVRSGKPSGFLAGADIKEFTKIKDTAGALALSAEGQQVFDRLAAVNAPTIAVIHGPCLGGGLELALACDYRLAFDKHSTQFGLPEVELGLLPGWGGTQRLPRVIGLERALQVILSAKRLNAKEAYHWGLADAYASGEPHLREEFTKLTLRAIAEGKRNRDRLPLKSWRQRLLESHPFGRKVIFQAALRALKARVPDEMPAPLEAFEAIKRGIERGIEEGLKREREGAARLALTPACRNLVNLFFQREEARKIDSMQPSRKIKSVGIVGAGTMGAGIAQLAALQGRSVVVQEVNAEALQAGLKRIDDLFAKAVERGRLDKNKASHLRSTIRGTINWEGFQNLDLVIEAAIEDLEVKRNLFREMATRTSSTTILATNTSSLAVVQVQRGVVEPGRIVGLHFFNPVHKMPLVEVVRGPETSLETMESATRFAIELGKTPTRVGDGPGFVVNRILMPYLDEAIRLVGEGMNVKDVDRLMRRFGMPMGPLELLDQIGLDVAAHVAQVVQAQLGASASPDSVFERMKERNWLGQKTKIGFYVHATRKQKPNREAQTMIQQSASGASSSMKFPEAARMAEARERLVLLMVNEASSILKEGLADANTIDLAMVFGTGWAPHRGGPLRYADDRGLADIVRSLEQLASRHGARFQPSEELQRRAASNDSFHPRLD